MTNKEFKAAARQHQIDFKTKDLKINRFPVFHMRRKKRDLDEVIEKDIEVRSSLLRNDACDENGNFVIFAEQFRKEITDAINKTYPKGNYNMVTNLLRSEHIPYNIFFPMYKDPAGMVLLFNSILGTDRISKIESILIEYKPMSVTQIADDEDCRLLKDGTAFDVFVPYTTENGKRGGIGIEVKYTEKEYPIKAGSKEWNETHDEAGNIHLSENYRKPSVDSGWFKLEYIDDSPCDSKSHVVSNHFRQIWRNHILGAAMLIEDQLEEFVSLTVYPEKNGHFSDDLWFGYENMLTPKGLKTLGHITYEQLFRHMEKSFSKDCFDDLSKWIDYLRERYLF